MRQKVQRKDKIIQRISSRIWKEPKDLIWSWLESIFNWKVVTLSGKKTGIYKKVRDRKLQNHFSTSAVAKAKNNFLHTCLWRCLQLSESLICTNLSVCSDTRTLPFLQIYSGVIYSYIVCCYISSIRGKKKKRGMILNHWVQNKSSVALGQSFVWTYN